MVKRVTVVGGGLAGSEAAWQLGERGIAVDLYEMRPRKNTGAHVSDRLAELICSNSLGSRLADRASGVLQNELKMLRSLLITVAENCAVPAGGALAVDRDAFSEQVTTAISNHPLITLIREEVTAIPPADTPTIIASGPLTAPSLALDIAKLAGQQHLYFYDAISPIVTVDSIDMSIAFRANRYRRGEDAAGDYINCPMNEQEYERFVDALLAAETIQLHAIETEESHYFEGCLPIEQMAARGRHTLAYGPMRPVGLRDPRFDKRPYAVVQLRRDNLIGTLYNIVGFQTNIRWGEQEKVLRLIPGLENAEFMRMGQMHRNTFINAPMLLDPTMRFRQRDNLFFAGQITGVEGYVGNVATGLVAAVNMARYLNSESEWVLPEDSMLGALCHYVSHAEPEYFQPMKANFGILPNLPIHYKVKRDRYSAYARRALEAMRNSMESLADPYLAPIPESSIEA